MNASTPLCAPTADAAFGPAVAPGCRHGFDFTLVFEQSVFVLLPAALLLVAAPLRLARLAKAPVFVGAPRLRVSKLVSRPSSNHHHPPSFLCRSPAAAHSKPWRRRLTRVDFVLRPVSRPLLESSLRCSSPSWACGLRPRRPRRVPSGPSPLLLRV